MSVISADYICPRHRGSLRIGPIAPPLTDGDAVNKLYVDTTTGHILPTFVSPLSYNVGSNSVTISEAGAVTSGYLNSTDQTIGGAKTFTGSIDGPGLNYEASNGWISGGTITMEAGGTQFSVSSVTARFTNYSVETKPVPGAVLTFPAVNNISIIYPTAINVGVYIDNTGAISQDAAPCNISLINTERIRLGCLIQSAGRIIAVTNSKFPVADRWQNLCLDYFLKSSPLNLNGCNVTSGGSDLSISVSTGTVWEQNANISVSRTNPSIISVAPITKPYMITFWRNNLGVIQLGSANQQLNTTLYNPGGLSSTLTSIQTGFWVNIPILFNPASTTFAFQYPTEMYSTSDSAISGLGNFIRLGADLNSYVIIGYVTVQEGSIDLSTAMFSSGQFFGYSVQMQSTQLSAYTPATTKQSNTVFIDQLIGDDTTGQLGDRGRPFRTVNNAVALITTSSNQNPYTLFATPGKHVDATLVLPPHIILSSYNQRCSIFEVGSNEITLDPVTWAAETENAILTLTNIQVTNTDLVANLRSIGLPPFTPAPGHWLSEIEISYSIIDGSIYYTARTSQDLLKIISSDIEENVTIDGGNLLMLNTEIDEGQTLTITSNTVNAVAIITGATLGDVVVIGQNSSLSSSVTISASAILGTLTVNGTYATVNINRGSLPISTSNIFLLNGGQLLVYDDLLNADEVAAIHANALLAADNAVADMEFVANGLSGKVPTTRTVNAKALSSNITITASDISTGVLPVAQLPSPIPVTCLATDTIGNNSTGSCYALAVSSLLPNGTTAYTQSDSSNNTRVATCAYLDRLRGAYGGLATLDPVTGKVPDAQINIAGIGALVYKGSFDASLIHDYPSVPPTINGNFWIISAAGTVSGTGYTTYTYSIGDWMIFNGTDWELIASDTLTIINAWTGSNNIHTVGTITAGTWNASPINASYGGVDGLTGLIKGMNTYATVAGVSDYVSPSIDNTITSNVTFTGSVLAPSVSRTDSSAIVATTSFVQSAANFKQANIMYKSMSGSDDRSGLSMNEAVLTFTQAMTNIAASSPSSSNQFVVYCEDASEDGPIALVPYVHLEATAMKLLGTNTVGSYSYIHVKRIDSPGGSGVSLHFTGGTDPTSVSVVRCYKLIGGSVLVDSNQGDVHIDIDEISGLPSTTEVIRAGSGSILFVKSCVLRGKIVADGTNCMVDLTGCKDISGCTFVRTAPSDPTCRIRYPANDIGDTTGILKCDGVGNVSAALSGTDYLIPTSQATLSGNITGSGSLNAAISTTITNGVVTLPKLGTIPAASVIGNPSGSATTPSTIGITSSIVANQIVIRDAYGSASLLHATESFRSAAIDNGVYNLTFTDSAIQEWTGADTASTEDIIMPDATTVTLGYKYQIYNSSAGVITGKDAGNNTLITILAGESSTFICKDTTTSTGQWATARQNVLQNMTGDVLGSGRGNISTTIAANAVTLSKLGSIPNACVLGNISGGNGGPFTVPAVITATASSVIVRDATQNAFARHFVDQLDPITITTTGTSLLSLTSGGSIQFAGSAAQYVYLPDATTLATGIKYTIHNTGTSPLYVSASTSTDTLVSLYGGVIGLFECSSTVGASGNWRTSVSSRRPPVFDRIYTQFMNSTSSNITASAVITTSQLWNGPQRTVNNITLTTPAAATLYTDLTTILGYPPPVGFNFQAYFLSSGNTQTWSAGSGCRFYPIGGITVANGTTGQFVIIIRSPTAYDFLSMR